MGALFPRPTPGAPQFRALSDQLYGSPDHHDVVRLQAYKGMIPIL
jgi:hypothetical protein